MWILRALMLLSLVVWIGGIIFFVFVTAPALFTILPSTKLAGDVVSVALRRLHTMGLVACVVFLFCSLIYNRALHAQMRLLSAHHVLLVLMLGMTAVSSFVVTPQMQELRRAPAALEDTAAQERFQALHSWSTRLEGATLICGLGAILATARRFQ